jgi:hypothetical protein
MVWLRYDIRGIGGIVVLLVVLVLVGQVRAEPAHQQGTAPTYTIFATRQGLVGEVTANGHTIQPRDRFVALPSFGVLSSYGGHEYQVRITYNGRSVVAPVWDVGPWNTTDDYWSPERRYGDLPVGVPMAQAAFLEGYNGGVDEMGRTVMMPNGIDIADGTFWDDLGMTADDWVQVSFLWLGSDPGSGSAANSIPPPSSNNQEIPPSMASDDWGGIDPYTAPAAPAQAAAAGQSQSQPQPQPPDVPQLTEGMHAVDNGDDGYVVNDATWYDAGCGLNGHHHWTYSTPDPAHSENHASWKPPTGLAPGWYELQAYIPACGQVDATRSARYRVIHGEGVDDVVLDQQAAAGTWASLGTFYWDAGTDTGQVELNDITSDSMQAIRYDALAWVDSSASAAAAAKQEPPPDTTPPVSRIVSSEPEETGFRVIWEGSDDRSGIASYDVQARRLPKGGWRDWLIEETATDAWFGPHEGKPFAFRVRARDKAGNVEEWSE